MDVHLAARLRKLVASGCSIRSAARELGVSRSAAMRAVSAAPVLDAGDEFDGSDDDDEQTISAMSFAGPAAVLTPPFEFVGFVDCLDGRGRPARDDIGRALGKPSLQWLDARGVPVGELDLYRWGQLWVLEVDPFDRAARRQAEAETEAVRRHAWDQVKAAGIEYDKARRRWVQRPRAV